MPAKKIKSPVRHRVARVPVIMQLEALECGAACLAMVMAYYRKWVPLEQVRVDCDVSRDGSKAKNILLAARSYGFTADGYRADLNALKEKVDCPCIIHWNFNHFVVLDGFRGNTAVINDPARGVVRVPMEEFDESFTGIVIQIRPDEGFVPGGKPKSTLAFARKRLKGAGAAVAFVTLTTIISHLFSLINPVMTRIFYERLLEGKNPGWLYPFIGVMALLCVIQLTVEWINTVYSLRINGKMSVMGSTGYMWKVLRLPMVFFTQRMTGDIVGRQSTNASIAGTRSSRPSPRLR